MPIVQRETLCSSEDWKIIRWKTFCIYKEETNEFFNT